MSDCIAAVPGCRLCAGNPRRRDGHACDDLCGMIRDLLGEPGGHEAWHTPLHCDHCSALIDDRRGHDRRLTRLCDQGTCERLCCPDCGQEQSSWGPAGCPSCNPTGRTSAWLAPFARAAGAAAGRLDRVLRRLRCGGAR